MFRPLAWTKTLAVGFSSVLAITLVPVLMILFIRGRLTPESRNPISRITQAIYLPVLRLCLRFRKTTLLLNLLFLVVTLPLALHIGSQFMPPLFEGSALYMPTALPGISIGQASQIAPGTGQDHPHVSRKSKPSSARWGDPTVRPITLPSICTTRRSCSSRAVSGEPE